MIDNSPSPAQPDPALADPIEAERRRMAALLQSSVVDPLTLLLAQLNAYEQALSSHQPSRTALAVLASLARQVLQQSRDLEEALRPTVLDELGLEPALDSLAAQARRVYGIHVELSVERLRDRPPRRIELELFRLAQDAIGRAAQHARARQVSIQLALRAERLALRLTDDGAPDVGLDTLRMAGARLGQLGGNVELSLGAHGGLQMVASVAVAAPAQLTPRELEVLRLLADGKPNKTIAAELDISPRTVNFHLDNLYTKLGVTSRTEAVVLALRRGWLRRER